MKNNLVGIFPNICMFLKISLTLPVGSVSTERSFTKLNLMKSRLRSTMTNDRLESLMTISCEYGFNTDYEEVLKYCILYNMYTVLTVECKNILFVVNCEYDIFKIKNILIIL